MREFMTQTTYADRIGVHKSVVCRGAQTGWVALTADGMVDVAETDHRRGQNVMARLPRNPAAWRYLPKQWVPYLRDEIVEAYKRGDCPADILGDLGIDVD